MSVSQKLVSAALSGFLVTLAFIWFADGESWYREAAFFLGCGAFFAVGVLAPLLQTPKLFSWRFAGLVLVSSLSFRTAVHIASDWAPGLFGPDLESYMLASLAGAAIVLTPAPLLLGLAYSLKFVVAGSIAAVLGGLLFFAFEEVFYYSLFLSFGIWHAAMCMALHLTYPAAAQTGWAASLSPSTRRRVALVVAIAIAILLAEEALGTLVLRSHLERSGGLTIVEPVTANRFRDQHSKPFLFNAAFGLFPLWKHACQIVRLADDAVIVEAVYFVYPSRLFDNSLGEVASWPEFLQQALPAPPD